MSDIIYVLRKQSFPECANEALKVVEQLIATHNAGRTVISKPLELAREIVAEFIFCERAKDNRSHPVPLHSMQELQLVEVLCNHFSSNNIGNEMVRIPQFLTLFPSGETARTQLLVKLVSIAIASRCRAVLIASGIWFQQTGVTTPDSMTLAKGLVDDYFILVPEAVKKLIDLPSIAPQFTANFLAAVAHLYSPAGGKDKPPPTALLAIVTRWISDMPALCRAGLATPLGSALPHGGIVMAPITPFAGLFRWCILAPLRDCQEDTKVYSQLHLALMESVLDGGKSSALVAAQHLAAIIPQLIQLSREAPPSALNRAADRMLQAVLVFLHTSSLYGNPQELLTNLAILPDNPLLANVKSKFMVC